MDQMAAEAAPGASSTDGAPPHTSLSAYLFGLRGSLVTHTNATVAPDTPMPQIDARTLRTTKDAAGRAGRRRAQDHGTVMSPPMIRILRADHRHELID